MRSSPRGLLAVVVLAACKPPGPGPGRVVPVPGGSDAGQAGTGAGSAGPEPGAVSPGASVGDLHQNRIINVEIAPDATAAVSVDQDGKVLLWPALDGTVVSRKLPVRGWRQAALARVGHRLVVAIINAADSLEIITTDDRGGDQTRVVLPPTQAVTRVAIVDGQVVAIGTDQALLLVSVDGMVRDRVATRETRLVALQPTAAGALVVARVVSGGSVGFEARRLRIRAGKLEVAAGVPLPVAPGREVFAASPDARVLAYPGPPATGAPTQPLTVVDLEGPAQPLSLPISISATASLAFTGPRDLALVEVSSASLVRLELGPSPTARTLPLGLPRAIGWKLSPTGVAVTGAETHLQVIQPDGSTRFLGHRFAGPSHASLAPSADLVAWHTDEATVVERVDGTWRRIIRFPRGEVTQVALVDDDHLLVSRAAGTLQLVALRGRASAAADGTIDATQLVLDEVSTPSSTRFEFEPSTGLLLAGVGEVGGVVALWELGAGQRRFGPRLLLPESAVFLQQASTGHAAVGVSGKSVHRYTLADLRDGVSIEEARDGRVELNAMPRIDRVDQRGRALHVRWRPTPPPAQREVMLADAQGVITTVPIGDSATVDPMPVGDGLLTLGSGSLAELRDLTGAVRWRITTKAPSIARWSGDGRRVVITSGGGGVVVDAGTGAVVLRGCGWAFGAYPTPATPRFSNSPECAD